MRRIEVIEDYGIVLPGGADKTMAQIDPLIYHEERSIYPRVIVAMSAGVMNGIGYVVQKAHKLPAIWEEVDPRRLFDADNYSLFYKPMLKFKKPVVNSPAFLKDPQFLWDIVTREIDFEAVLNSPVTIWIGVLNLTTGKIQWYSNKDAGMTPRFFREITFASILIPILFKPRVVRIVYRGGYINAQLADAGVVTTIAIDRVVAEGCTKILAIDSLPQELLPVAHLEIWPEIYDRVNDIAHVHEAEAQSRWTEQINSNVRWFEELSSHWLVRFGFRVCPKLRVILRSSPVAEKKEVALKIVHVPPDIAIFHKNLAKYGTPSSEVRRELLDAGRINTEKQIVPFLREQGIIT
jgi:predicted acylesterase/phospholipase RssA